MKAEGTTVFMWREQWEGETIEQMRAWDRPGRSSLLKKGPGFRHMNQLGAEEEETSASTGHHKLPVRGHTPCRIITKKISFFVWDRDLPGHVRNKKSLRR